MGNLSFIYVSLASSPASPSIIWGCGVKGSPPLALINQANLLIRPKTDGRTTCPITHSDFTALSTHSYKHIFTLPISTI